MSKGSQTPAAATLSRLHGRGDYVCPRLAESDLTRLGGFWLAASTCNHPPAELFGLGVGDIKLARAPAGIREGNPNCRASTVGNFLTRNIGYTDCLTCQANAPLWLSKAVRHY